MNKKVLMAVAIGLFVAATGCQKSQEDVIVQDPTKLSVEEIALVKAAGFNPYYETFKNPDGTYIVEGDVQVTKKDLESWANAKPSNNIIVGNEEHYHTFNLVKVTGAQRTITINMPSTYPSQYQTALNNTIKRYNDLGLTIKFSKTTSTSANIKIQRSDLGGFDAQNRITLGRASGFPTSTGNPAPSFTFNSNPAASQFFDTVIEVDEVLCHEIGHLIGFRHTDYTTRKSCNENTNEGQTTTGVGAVYIPGTVTAANVSATNSSWMMACVNGNAGFTSGDIKALKYVY